MTAPTTAALCWLKTLGVGGILGMFYSFLRPLRPRFTVPADLFFALATLWGWLYGVFAICGGDSRMSCTVALLLGIQAMDATAGSWLQPVFSLFWKSIFLIFQLFFWPARKFLQYFFTIHLFISIYGNSSNPHFS